MLDVPYICYTTGLKILYILGFVPMELLRHISKNEQIKLLSLGNLFLSLFFYIKAKKNNSIDMAILSTIAIILSSIPYIMPWLLKFHEITITFYFTSNITTSPISLMFLGGRLILFLIYIFYKI